MGAGTARYRKRRSPHSSDDFLQFAFGGPGFAVPLGLFLAGVSISAGLTRLIPRWLMWFGLILAVIGELELVQHGRPRGFVPHSTDAIPSFCLADRRRVPAAEVRVGLGCDGR